MDIGVVVACDATCHNRAGRILDMLIALEGLEGVGKTTLGTLLAEAVGATYIKSPPTEMNAVRDFVAAALHPGVNFYFYLAGLCALQGPIEEALATGPVIVDRYIDSTIAYHHFGQVFVAPPFAPEMLRSPDFRVLITCPESRRIERIVARGHHIFERHASDEVAIAKFLAQRADLIFENVGTIDQSVAELSALIVQRLGQNV